MTRTLAFRLVATGLVFLVTAVASIALNLWMTWQMEGGAAAVNEAGRMRMMTYRMALDLSAGRRDELARREATMESTLELLRAGDPSRPLFIPDTTESRERLARVREEWTRLRATWDRVPAGAPVAVDTARVDAAVHTIDDFVGAIEHQLAHWNAAMRAFQLALVGLAVLVALLFLYASHVLVLEPLRRLGQAIGRLRAGDLGARADRESTAEFREVGDGFDSMAARLQGQYEDLERTVQAKTAALQRERERLSALYEVSAFVAGAETLDELARGFVGLVRRIARADAVALRWSDAGNARYLMLAQEGLPPTFAAEEQCLVAGQCRCGPAAEDARTRVIPIRAIVDGESARASGGEGAEAIDGDGGDEARGDDALDHCARAGFETVMTVPVRLQHRLHGEVALFFRDATDVNETDRSLMELLASHLAGGMEALRAAAADKEAAVSGERALIAQELHDSIAQTLAFLKIQVALLRVGLQRRQEEDVKRAVGDIEEGVLECYADVRELLVHFRTRADSEDIEPALRTTCAKFQHQTGVEAHLEITGHGVALPADTQVQVLHVVQEALSNVRKHANAKGVTVRVRQAPEWRFEVQDDGIGFDPEAGRDDTHVGLRIMRERAARIGGRLAVTSSAGAGTRVVLVVPPDAHVPPLPPVTRTARTPRASRVPNGPDGLHAEEAPADVRHVADPHPGR